MTKVEYCTVKQKCLGRLRKKIAVRSTVRVAEGNLLLSTSSSRGPRQGCLRQRALRVTHGPSWSPSSPAAAEQWIQPSGVHPRVPLLPPFLSSLLLATWGFSSSCSMAVSSGAAAGHWLSRTWPRPHFSPCGSSQPSPLCLPTLSGPSLRVCTFNGLATRGAQPRP